MDPEAATRTGLAAVTRVAASLALPADDLRVVSDRGNLLVHLAPAPVLARVATLTAWTRRDPFAWLQREVTVAGHAAARGGPVVPPAARPGPFRVHGLALSLWEFRETIPGRAGGADLGASLARLHAALAGAPGPLPVLTPAHDQIDGALHALERAAVAPAHVLAALRDTHAAVLAELDGAGSAPVVLHGDAHAGNLLRCVDGAWGDGWRGDGWLWADLEETCLGPPEWDLAVMAGGRDTDGPAALAGYAAATGGHVPSAAELAPFRRARKLEATAWLLAMAHQDPARYRTPAAEHLAALLG